MVWRYTVWQWQISIQTMELWPCVFSMTLDCLSSYNRTEKPLTGPTEVPCCPFYTHLTLGMAGYCLNFVSWIKEGDVSLYPIQHILYIGQLHLVLPSGALVASNHMVNFFMNLGCTDRDHECNSQDVFLGDLVMFATCNRRWPRKGS